MNRYVFYDMQIGMTGSFDVEITNDMQEDFLRHTGDINPLHCDSTFSTQRGFADKVVYGMLVASLYSTLVGVYLPGKYCILQEITTSFRQVVYIGDHLTVSGTVADIRESTGRVRIKGLIKNQHGEIVNTASISIGFTGEDR